MKGILVLGGFGAVAYLAFTLLCALIGGVGLATPVEMPAAEVAEPPENWTWAVMIPRVGKVTVQARRDAHADIKHRCSNMPPQRIRDLIDQGLARIMTDGKGNFAAVVTDPETGLVGGRIFFQGDDGVWREKTAFGGDECDPTQWDYRARDAWRMSKLSPDQFYWTRLLPLWGFRWLS